MMKSFEKMDNKIDDVKKNVKFVHTALMQVIHGFERRSMVFSLLVSTTSLTLLIVIALMFDYLNALNPVLLKINIWLTLLVLLGAITQLFYLFVLSSAQLALKEYQRYKKVLRHLSTLQGYETGYIDEEGIRQMYMNTAEKMHTMHPQISVITTKVDWILYTTLMLCIVLFGLIFI